MPRVARMALAVLLVSAVSVAATDRRGLEVVDGAAPYGVRGATRTVAVRITDAGDRPRVGATVSFITDPGSGAVTPTSVATDDAGLAVATWVLGDRTGPQRLTVEAGADRAAIEVTATAPPAALVIAAGDGGEAPAGSPVARVPAVRVDDAQGAPVPGVPVTFTVAAGGGRLGANPGQSSVVVPTDGQGRAAPSAWTLGTRAGPANQTVRAEVDGLPPRVFTATATAGPPAAVVVVSGGDQTGEVAAPLPVAPTVRVEDAWGNPVGGVSVLFDPTGGFARPSRATTDAAGRASTSWTLGPDAGAWALDAAVPGGPAGRVAATATGTVATCALTPPTDGFDIHVCGVGALDGPAATALADAVARWESLVVGDLPDEAPPADHPTCAPGAPWVRGPAVDDLVVYVTLESVDGPGGALAGAAPCMVREDGGLPLFARLRIDADDVDDLAARDRLREVLIHELAHALGFGTLWPASGYLREPAAAAAGAVDTHFAGPRAVAAFDAAGGRTRSVGAKVPVQHTGGSGVVDLHWRESVMGNELLTAFPDAGGPNPLSAVTLASLADLGYTVDLNLADPYVVPFPNLSRPDRRSP